MSEKDYANPSGPITIGSFIHHKPGMSEEEFYRCWHTQHGAKVAPWAEKYGLVTYRQFHTPSSKRKKWTEATGIQCLEVDGYAEATFATIEGHLKATQDPYYQEVVDPDHDRFWNAKADTKWPTAGGITSMAGVVRYIVKDGKVVGKPEGEGSQT